MHCGSRPSLSEQIIRHMLHYSIVYLYSPINTCFATMAASRPRRWPLPSISRTLKKRKAGWFNIRHEQVTLAWHIKRCAWDPQMGVHVCTLMVVKLEYSSEKIHHRHNKHKSTLIIYNWALAEMTVTKLGHSNLSYHQLVSTAQFHRSPQNKI